MSALRTAVGSPPFVVSTVAVVVTESERVVLLPRSEPAPQPMIRQATNTKRKGQWDSVKWVLRRAPKSARPHRAVSSSVGLAATGVRSYKQEAPEALTLSLQNLPPRTTQPILVASQLDAGRGSTVGAA